MKRQRLFASSCCYPRWLIGLFILMAFPASTFAQDCEAGKIYSQQNRDYLEICLGQDADTEVQFRPQRPHMEFLYCLAVTDTAGTILGVSLTNSVDFGEAGPGICYVYGVNFSGQLTANLGENLFDTQISTGCSDISENFVTVRRTEVDGAMVSTLDGMQEVITCPGDGVADAIQFANTSESGEAYRYIVTDEEGYILGLPPGNEVNFEGAGPGTCRVYGVSFSGEFSARLGQNIRNTNFCTGCFELSENFVTVDRQDIDGGKVETTTGETEIYTCAGDGEADEYMFVNNSEADNAYGYIITDENGTIIGIPDGNSQDFEGAGEGVCLVWGVSYTGNLTASQGDNIKRVAISDECFELSSNFITVNRTEVDGGTVSTPDGGTEVATCAGDGEDDIIMFAHESTSGANYAYVVTDEAGTILGLPPGNEVNFEGAGEGVCLVWGLSYTGEIQVGLGDNALEADLTDGCFELSENVITVTRTGVDGGEVSTIDGEMEVATCAGDGEDDIIMFMHETSSSANFAYVVTDEEGVILGLPPGNEVNFEGAGEGVCLVWGLSYTGEITVALGDNALEMDLSDGCFDLSENFVTVNRTGVDGGTVSTADGESEIMTCAGDGVDDLVMFMHETSSSANFAYVVTDTAGIILGLPPGNEVNFEGAGEGVCLVWGLSYTGEVIAELGQNALEVSLVDGCYDLSDGFVTVVRTGVDGGEVSTVDGESEIDVCAGDGEDDIIMFMHETSSSANFAYVVTDEEGVILGLPPGNEVNFEGAGEGICLVWGLSYTGEITVELGDNALEEALTDGCFSLSEGFVTVNRTGVDGGTVSTVDGESEIMTCAGDGVDDVVMFMHETSSSANFAYVVTDQDGIILGLPPGNEVNFEGAGEGTCLVWGLSYTGEVIAELGQNALEVDLVDGCYDLSDGFVTVVRTGVDGGEVSTVDGEMEVDVCAGDGEDDLIMFMHESSSSANFAYVVTDEEGVILGLPPGNEVNFEGAGQGICLVWGLSYTGEVTAALGDNALEIALSDGCFSLSEGFVTVNRTGVDGGTVTTVDSLTSVRTCVGDGEADVIMFMHETSAPANFAYVVTDTLGTILGLPPGNEVDFEGAGVGVCLVWGLSYTGEITVGLGDNALEAELSDGCWDLSEGFVTVTRDTICEIEGTSVMEIPSTQTVVTYPNPAQNTLVVRLTDDYDGDYFLNLMDLQGKVLMSKAELMSKGDPYIQLDVESLDKGIYVLHLETQEGTTTTKFIKN